VGFRALPACCTAARNFRKNLKAMRREPATYGGAHASRGRDRDHRLHRAFLQCSVAQCNSVWDRHCGRRATPLQDCNHDA
jgi:hypothetical protein